MEPLENFVGVEIGGTKLQLVVGDSNAAIRERRMFAVDAGLGAAGIRKQIEGGLRELLTDKKAAAIGVGFGGPVNWKSGRICRSHQIEGWSEFDLSGWLAGVSGLPVHVDNDANVAALGEALHGAGVGCNPVFYVTLGSGVGGGLVVDQRIYHGATPGEAEIGHIRLERNGATVESRCSGWAVDARVREMIAREPSGLLAQLAGGQVGAEARHLASAVEKGDPSAGRLLTDVGEDLAFGLSHVVHLFHPEVIVLGGGLSQIGEWLRGAVVDALRRFVMEAFAPGPRIALAKLGKDAVPVGALELAKARGKSP